MPSVPVPLLSAEALAFIASIVPQQHRHLELDALTPDQLDQLLCVAEAELELTTDPDRRRAIGEFAAALIRRA